jgi:tetratricopeptide (TPR) repeat protein
MPTSEPHRRRGARTRSNTRGLLVVSSFVLLALSGAACGSTTTTPPKVSSTAVDALITAGNASQRKGQSTLAASLYTKAIADDPTNAVALYDLGDLDQIALHDSAAAEADYRRALLVDPRFVDARFNLAILESASHSTSAIAAYEIIIGIDASDADAYLNLGFLLRATGKTAAGAAALHKAVTLDPALQSRLSQPVSAK